MMTQIGPEPFKPPPTAPPIPVLAADAAPGPPPLAYLAAVKEPGRYGRSDCLLAVASAFVTGANASMIACLVLHDSHVWGVWAIAVWGFIAAHLLLWAGGQAAFWACRPGEQPRFSTFTLACVGAAALICLVGNTAYTFIATR